MSTATAISINPIEDQLERIRTAVESHRADRSAPGADARLYSAVLAQPLELVDSRTDDPNDWPAP